MLLKAVSYKLCYIYRACSRVGSHSDGSALRQRAVVHNDGCPQEVVAPPVHRRHPRRLPHPRRCRLPRRHPHRPLRRARPLLPLLARHQLPWRRLRRGRRRPDPQADRWRRVHHRLEHRRHLHYLRRDRPHHPVAHARGGAAHWRRRRARGGGLRFVGRRGEVRQHQAQWHVG